MAKRYEVSVKMEDLKAYFKENGVPVDTKMGINQIQCYYDHEVPNPATGEVPSPTEEVPPKSEEATAPEAAVTPATPVDTGAEATPQFEETTAGGDSE